MLKFVTTKTLATLASVLEAILFPNEGEGIDGARLRENKKTNDFMFSHPMLAFYRFIRSIGSEKLASARQPEIDKLVADGMSEEDAAEKVAKQITRDTINARDKQILVDLASHTIPMTDKMTNKLISLLKAATSWSDTVSLDDLDACFELLARYHTENAENSTLSYDTLASATPIPAEFLTPPTTKGKKETVTA